MALENNSSASMVQSLSLLAARWETPSRSELHGDAGPAIPSG